MELDTAFLVNGSLDTKMFFVVSLAFGYAQFSLFS